MSMPRRNQRVTSGVFLNHFLPYFQKQGLSLNLELTDSGRLADQQAQSTSYFHLPSARITGTFCCPWFLCGCLDQTQVSMPVQPSTPSTVPAPYLGLQQSEVKGLSRQILHPGKADGTTEPRKHHQHQTLPAHFIFLWFLYSYLIWLCFFYKIIFCAPLVYR